ALYVTGYAASLVLRSQGVRPDGVGAHSIGEYAALAAGNVFSFQDGMTRVRERGRLMGMAGKSRPGGMAAILGLDAETLKAVCESVRVQGICIPVNFNSPEQIVIAGDSGAVLAAAEAAKAKGAKRAIPLNVSGAFHSPLMAESAAAMRQHLEKVSFQDASVPVAM